jgi:NitT/TauT family transport system substrate-binding protein
MTWIPYVQRRYGITFSLRPNTYGLGEFLANRDAVQQGLVTHEPFFAAQHGRPVRALLLADSGYDCYPAVVVRAALLRADPAVVRAFVAASIRGWIDYIQGDPAPAERLILARNREMTPELLAFSRGEMIRRQLVAGDPARGERVGQLALPRIAALVDTLVGLKVLDAPLPVAKLATAAFLPDAP